MKRRLMTTRGTPVRTWFTRMLTASVLIVASAVGFGIPLSAAYAQEPAGSVIITSDPAGAHVTINGRRVGVTPFDISMGGGSELAVSVELDGYVTFTTHVKVKADGAETIHAALEASPAKATDTPTTPTE